MSRSSNSGIDNGGRAVAEKIFGKAPGQFIQTTHGITHYQLEGKNDTPLVILQHGIGSDSRRYDQIVQDLHTIGFRTLRYDFYDRGYSETDPTLYPVTRVGVHPIKFTMEIHIQQMQDVLMNLGLENTPFIHCGHSMGGLTGIAYAATYPQQVKGLILVDAVCLPVSKPLPAIIANLPILGNIIVKYFGIKTFIKFSKNSVVNPDMPEIANFLQLQAQNAQENARFFAAIRSTNRYCRGMIDSAEIEYRKCCQANIPIHLIWGKDDTSCPYENCVQMKQIAQQEGTTVTETSFDGMPHNVFFPDAKPNECSKSICDFVTRIYEKNTT